jgi:hypothetical protein
MIVAKIAMESDWYVLPKEMNENSVIDALTPGVFVCRATNRDEAECLAYLARMDWAGKKLIVERSMASLFPLPPIKEVFAQARQSIRPEPSSIIEVDKPKRKKTIIRVQYKDGFCREENGYETNKLFSIWGNKKSWQVVTTWSNDYVISAKGCDEAGMIANWFYQFCLDCECDDAILSVPTIQGLQKMVQLYYGGHVFLKSRI